MKFTFIDFETATKKRDSICAVGISVWEDAKEIDSFYSLIKPEPFKIDPFCEAIHHLGYFDLKDESIFADVYPRFKKYLSGIVIAHNCKFDMVCLARSLYNNGLEFPDFQYVCSLEISGVKLKELADRYNLPPYAEHNALADARTLGAAYWHLRKEMTPEYCQRFICDFKALQEKEIKRARREAHKMSFTFDFDEIESEISPEPDNKPTAALPFQQPEAIEISGHFVITGSFLKLSRAQLESYIKENGGTVSQSPSKKTNYIIVGSVKNERWAYGDYGTKIAKALTLPQIVFIDETYFAEKFFRPVEAPKPPITIKIVPPKPTISRMSDAEYHLMHAKRATMSAFRAIFKLFLILIFILFTISSVAGLAFLLIKFSSSQL